MNYEAGRSHWKESLVSKAEIGVLMQDNMVNECDFEKPGGILYLMCKPDVGLTWAQGS